MLLCSRAGLIVQLSDGALSLLDCLLVLDAGAVQLGHGVDRHVHQPLVLGLEQRVGRSQLLNQLPEL